MSDQSQPSEEELRAAYEAQIKQLRVEDVLVQTVVSLVNLGGRKAGLAPDTEDERDPRQLQQAIDGTLAILPLVEQGLDVREAAQIRQAVSQLQMAYARMAGAPEAGGQGAAGAGSPQSERPQQPPPTQSAPRSSRLWVPGQ